MTEATRILTEFKRTLDRHFGLAPVSPRSSAEPADDPVRPEHRPSVETLARFAELVRGDDGEDGAADVPDGPSLEERIRRIEALLGLPDYR